MPMIFVDIIAIAGILLLIIGIGAILLAVTNTKAHESIFQFWLRTILLSTMVVAMIELWSPYSVFLGYIQLPIYMTESTNRICITMGIGFIFLEFFCQYIALKWFLVLCIIGAGAWGLLFL